MLSFLRKREEERLKRRTTERMMADAEVARRVQRVLSLSPSAIEQGVTATDARSLPGNPEFVASGWSELMLLRYFLAMERSEGQDVLDSCSGLGWGSYLVSARARSVVGVDIDAGAVGFATRQWGAAEAGRPPPRFVVGSVLELPFEGESFGVVLCMDAIEHFTASDGQRYLAELGRVCRPGGRIVGSSSFPETRAEADDLCRKNEHHLHVLTRGEVRALLKQQSWDLELLTRHYFIARRAK
jgi:SAM-dependent methyltransferase